MTALALLLTLLSPPPRLVLLQLGEPGKDRMENVLAQALTEAGRVEPVVLSNTDPVYREAANSGRLGDPPADRKGALRAAEVLGAEYLMEYRVERYGERRKGIAVLLRRGKSVWTDTQIVANSVAQRTDADGSLLSIARTWAIRLGEGPFRPAAGESPGAVAPPSVDPLPMDVSEPPVTAPAPPAPDEDAAVEATVASLLKEDKLSRALATVRDAVDQRPLSAPRRRLLVKLLIRTGGYVIAAEEARRASDLLTEGGAGLRLDAARAWLLAGRPDEAKNDLNEALARGAGAEAQALLADLELRRGRPEVALRAAESALKAGPSEDALLSRAIARAMLGGAEGVAADLGVLAGLKTDDAGTAARYARAVTVVDPSTPRLGDEIRSLIQRAAVRRTDAAVMETADDLGRRIASRIALGAGLPAPTAKALAAARRALALRLLAQSVEELRSYLGSGEEDALRDARISLGEGLAAAKAAIELEAA